MIRWSVPGPPATSARHPQSAPSGNHGWPLQRSTHSSAVPTPDPRNEGAAPLRRLLPNRQSSHDRGGWRQGSPPLHSDSSPLVVSPARPGHRSDADPLAPTRTDLAEKTAFRGDGFRRRENVGQPLVVVPAHSAIASARTLSRIPAFNVVAGTTSTSTPSSSASSLCNAAKHTTPTPLSRSTSRSTSLASVSSPRATLPKTRALRAPRRAASSRTARRCRRKRRPSRVSGSPSRSGGAGTRSTETR